MKNGITLATTSIVKKTITYRQITIAIGIIVAMVVALTLWIRIPEEKLSGTGRLTISLPENIFHAAVKMFSDQTNASLDRP